MISMSGVNASYSKQNKLKKELEKEMEQHKDDIQHLELLRKHYEEREKAYEVRFYHALQSNKSQCFCRKCKGRRPRPSRILHNLKGKKSVCKRRKSILVEELKSSRSPSQMYVTEILRHLSY